MRCLSEIRIAILMVHYNSKILTNRLIVAVKLGFKEVRALKALV